MRCATGSHIMPMLARERHESIKSKTANVRAALCHLAGRPLDRVNPTLLRVS